MQCLLSSCCSISPKVILSILGFFGLALGVFSAFNPKRSMGLYRAIMKFYNWNVSPINEAREVRNTRLLGICLALLCVVLMGGISFRF